MLLPSKRGCSYHTGDNSGKTYDSEGNICASLSSEDKEYLAAGMGFCGAVLLGLICFWLVRWRRARSKSRQALSTTTEPMSMSAPLITTMRSTMGAFSYRGSPLPSESSHLSAPSEASHCSSNSPYAFNSESFHFPILSADGHLLPPVPASSRRSLLDVKSEGYHDSRPLPSPPLTESPEMPTTPTSWTFSFQDVPQPGNVIGLFPEDYTGLYDEDMHYETKEMRYSPSIARVDGSAIIYEPQSATIHRSFSSEGNLAYETR